MEIKERKIIGSGRISKTTGKIGYTDSVALVSAVYRKFRPGELFNVIFEKRFRKRTPAQNAYYWAVIIEYFLEGYRDTNGHPVCTEFAHPTTGEILYFPLSHKEQAERAHEYLKQLFNEGRSTTANSTSQQEDLHAWCREFIQTAYKVRVPLPNEIDDMEFNEAE